MNYKKIYEDLIEHRKMLPKLEGAYYEKHHIVPRCMGGTNDKSNLIYLTADDHFMAHMLLAKAYGGKLWAAAQAMSLAHNGRDINNRRLFKIARENFSKSVTGMKSPIADQRLHKFVHLTTGTMYETTQLELRELFGLKPKVTSSLVSGLAKVSGGFALYDENTPIHLLGKEDKNIYNFVNLDTGEVVPMSRYQAAERLGIPVSHMWGILNGRAATVRNWSLVDLVLQKGDSALSERNNPS